MAYIKVIPYQESEGKLKEIYEDLIKKRGKLAAVHQIQSLNPESIVQHMDLYLGVMFGRSPLSRAHREMMAVVVSTANRCKYCISHHAGALNHFWKDPEKVQLLSKDYLQVELTESQRVLCDYAYDLTRNPINIEESDQIQSLKDVGWEDRAILDAALVISYFNFVNRMVLGLGVHLEGEDSQGYNYE